MLFVYSELTYHMFLHIWNDYKKIRQNDISLFKNDMTEYITMLKLYDRVSSIYLKSIF